MNKYIDADELTEQLKHYLDIQPATDGLPGKYSYEARGVKQAIDYALSLIKDFQQDQPDVGKAANKYLHKWDIDGIPTTSYTWDDMVDCFRAGAEWQKQQMMKEA